MKKVLLLSLVALSGLLPLTGCNSEETIIVGLEADYAPFNWYESRGNNFTAKLDNASGYVDGYDVQISKKIGEELGKKVVFKQLDWDGLIPALNSFDIDMVLAGMSPTAERKVQIDFSDEYFRSEVVMVVKTGGTFATATSIADFSGARVVAQSGTLYDDLIKQIPSVTHLTPRDTYPLLALAVDSNDADAFISELPVAQSITSKNNNLSIIRLTTGGFEIEDEEITVAVGIRKGETELLNGINAALAKITAADRNSLMLAALGRSDS